MAPPLTPEPAPGLHEDPTYRQVTFVVIDFETTTPTGHRPEPVDVAVIVLRTDVDRLVETDRYTALIRPPDHAPLTPFDTAQTGISPAMLADRPPAAQILAELDARLGPHLRDAALLVAHNAPTEAGLLFDRREHCPQLATTNLLDTVRLARVAYPDLPSHRLDVLIHHLKLTHPPDRHRAMPDVQITAQVFGRLLRDGHQTGCWSSLRDLRRHGEYQAKAARPEQTSLF
ncbi:MAG: 3'-5' exonuclease [Actinobacteria bacterium]|nr:3'-5' exonuclease [Actinomycetota bacterium]MBI3686014.1 3'-5' exonuclease [Actinomycetota bacterium]